MFLFSLPSSLLTLDVVVEEADSAPMDDGALACLLWLEQSKAPCTASLRWPAWCDGIVAPSRWAPAAYAGTLYDAATVLG